MQTQRSIYCPALFVGTWQSQPIASQSSTRDFVDTEAAKLVVTCHCTISLAVLRWGSPTKHWATFKIK
jgi:hypothetical protein